MSSILQHRRKIFRAGGNGLLTGLSHFYEYENNSNDSHGSNTGSDTSMNYSNVVYKLGTRSGEFSGSGYIALGSNVFSGATSGSVFTWIRRDTVGTSQHTIIDETESGVKNHFQVIVEGSGGNANKVRLYINNSATYSTGTIGSVDTRYSVGVTFDGVNSKFYINGSASGSSSETNTVATNSETTYIGQTVGGGGRMDGFLDNTGIWVGTVLTADHFASLHNSGSGLAYSEFTN